MLCTECTTFKENFESLSVGHRDHTYRTPFKNHASLERSALSGCLLCRIIYQTWHIVKYSKTYKEGSPIRVIGRVWGRNDSDSDSENDRDSENDHDNKIQNLLPPRLREKSIFIHYADSGKDFILEDCTYSGIDEKQFGEFQHLLCHTIDRDAPHCITKIASLASEWLQNCRQTHHNCCLYHIKGESKVLPTRLVDVGTDIPGQPPRLFIPLRHLRSLEYIALSYAWGSIGNFVKTTSSNLEAMTRCLPWPQLPKTIRDAIIVTRGLGIRYLWVDALCILQSEGPDDAKHKEDWSNEAVRFGQYYENALLTIAATGASSSNDGLLFKSPISKFGPISFTFRPKGAMAYTIRSRVPSWLSETQYAPLSDRGWAVQERLLSRRVLHFAENLILWECHDVRATELDQQGRDPAGPDDFRWGPDECMTECRDLYAKGLKSEDFMDEWYSFLRQYSNKSFTFVSDRLPALSGVGAIVQQQTRQKYIAGLWESDIPRGLLWMNRFPFRSDTTDLANIQTSDDPKKAHSQPTIPSWCWAASRGYVEFLFQRDLIPKLQVESWKIESQGTSTSGQLRGGSLTVRGLLAILNLADLGFVPHPSTDIADHVLGRHPEKSITNFFELVCMDVTVDSQVMNLSHPCLLIGSATITTMIPLRQATGGAIILQATGRRLGLVKEYRRIGFMSLPLEECLSIFEEVVTVILV